MERLTTNKEVSEMSMVELAHNSCYAKEHKVRYRDYDTDIDARELTIKLLDEFVNIPNEFTCDEDFDEFIVDAMQYGIHNIIGLIAIFYRNLWAMADLRERLKEYEDLGLTPNQLKEVDKLYTEKCKQLSDMSQHFKKSGNWIPCSERMPEPEEEVFILTQNGTMTTAMYEDGTIYTDNSKWFWYVHDLEYDEGMDDCIIPEGWWEYKHFNPGDVNNNAVDEVVVAWMSLPKPYKG